MKMPDVTYVDSFVVPNYENRDPAPKYQMPFTAGRLDEVHPGAGGVQAGAVREGAGHHQADRLHFDERGRLWIIEAIDYPNLVLNGQPGDDRIKILEDTNGDGRADKFTVFADRLNLPTSLVVRQRRRDRRGGAAHAVPEGHQRRRQGRRAADPQHRLGHPRHARRPVEPDVRARQLHLGHRRLLRLQRRDERQADAVRPGRLPLQAGWLGLRVHDRLDQQHVGPRLLRDLRRVRLDGEQRSELLRRDSQPLLRGRRGAADAAGRRPRRRRRLSERGAVLHRALRHAVHPSGRRVRRLHRRRRPSALHGARVPEAGTGTASRSSPSRPRIWSARASSRSAAPGS